MGYPSDVSDAEWDVISPLLPDAKQGGRPRTTDLRDIVNAIFYVSLGLILECVVHPADVQDRDGARLVLEGIVERFPRLQKIWADGAYAGKLVDWTKELGQWVLEIVKRSDTAVGFEVLPHRWIVERTFAWLGRLRRLSKDYEALIETSETMIRIAMIRLMVRRLAVS